MNPQIVGNVGLYFVCYELSRRGWNVMPTARNARGVDIIAYDLDASHYLGVQVKALSRKNPVPLGGSLERLLGDFWVIVNSLDSTPGVFVLTPAEIKALAQRREKQGRVSFWLQPRSYMTAEFNGRWDRLRSQRRARVLVAPVASPAPKPRSRTRATG